MKNSEIAKIVVRIQNSKDKDDALEELYREIWSTVYYFCYKHLGNEDDASDAMQTVFTRLFEKLDKLQHPNAFNAFLCTIMKNICFEFQKSRQRDGAIAQESIEDYEQELLEDNIEFLPDAAFNNHEIRSEVQNLIAQLPYKQREAILLFYFEEFNLKEIADITHSELGAVKNRLAAARKTLKRHAMGLVEQGVLNSAMALGQTPLLTLVLREEAERVATPQICEVIWQDISIKLEFTSGPSQVGAEIQSAAVSETAKTVTSVAAANTTLCLCLAAAVATCAVLVYTVYESIIHHQPQRVYHYSYTYEKELSIPTFEIPYITDRVQFLEFVETHGFSLVGGTRSNTGTEQIIYYLQHHNKTIYLSYTIDSGNNFHTAYEIIEGT